MPNHLKGQSSRYLLQHADNPVDWYPWCDEALERARREDKPIFLSIGYSACHWCHVMAHESFEDEATAALLNEYFVSIKVDREERLDLDRIYMGFVQASTGSGGWPMSVFLTPEGVPFYGGTYFPKVARFNMPAFSDLLRAISDAWQNRRESLLESSERVLDVLRRQQADGVGANDAAPDRAVLERAFQTLMDQHDSTSGGWGGAPKFPQPMTLEFLLRYHHTTGDARSLEMVTRTLDAMARGGIYDQLGGGFHRYSVDAHWLVPHFEKMLYDNAQLARVYLHAWQVVGESQIPNRESQRSSDESRVTSDESAEGEAALFRAVVEETLDYVIREMLAPGGGFYATQDADSEGEEGKFFVWTPDEIRGALGGPATRFLELYGVTEAGNFEERSILTFGGTIEERQAIAGASRLLFAARTDRVPPGRDEKIVTSWNGLMLAAFAEAARALDRDDYLRVAERNADFLLRELRGAGGRLWHVWKDGTPSVAGFLEDYTHLIEGLLALYQTTFDARWFTAAAELADVMLAHFQAADSMQLARQGQLPSKAAGLAGFYDTADDAETLVVRPRDVQDNAVPSGNAMAVTVMLKLAGFTGDARYADTADRALASMTPADGDVLDRHPQGFGQWLQALAYALSRPREIAIVGDPVAADTRALLSAVRAGYRPFQIVAFAIPEADPAVPLLEHRELVEGRAAAYVCRAFVCRTPVVEAEKLRTQLASP